MLNVIHCKMRSKEEELKLNIFHFLPGTAWSPLGRTTDTSKYLTQRKCQWDEPRSLSVTEETGGQEDSKRPAAYCVSHTQVVSFM